MRLEAGGVDIFYVDESMDTNVFAMSAIAIPFLRQVEGTWTVVWEEQFENIRDWRRNLSRTHQLPVRKELNGSKFASGRGRFRLGKHQFTRYQASVIYRDMLANTTFLPDMSIISVVGKKTSDLYGYSRLEALLYAMLQRFRTACHKNKRRGLVFFDEGHGEYRKLYRKARKYLPTGSAHGSWGTGTATRNMPLDNFTKDANIKESAHSFYIQLADIISFAALLKVRGENKSLAPWQAALNLETLYDAIPVRVLNTRAHGPDPQGIVRL